MAVLTASVLQGTAESGQAADAFAMNTTGDNMTAMMTGSSIESTADRVRHRINDISFNNTTELNSTVYFCRLNNNEFNYSSNPTYLSSSKMVVKNTQTDSPVAYVTSAGLYSSDNELLATAKLSEPIKKTPDVEQIIRVRLDY